MRLLFAHWIFVIALSPRGSAQELDRYPIDDFIDWARDTAIPITTLEARSGFDDLGPLADVIGDARLVALGEATHGTREFFQLKHRLFEFLVERKGFTVFAIEATFARCVPINEYVEHGIGDAVTALNGQGFWIWNTEEVLDLIEWMREYNADPRHETKLRFYGVDMQEVTPALVGALSYVQEHEPELATTLQAELGPLMSESDAGKYSSMSQTERRPIDQALLELRAFLESEAERLVEASSERAWTNALHHVTAAEQAKHLLERPSHANNFYLRDKYMAENTSWIFDHEPPGTRIALWAHNGHVKKGGAFAGKFVLGTHLAEKYGDDLIVVGFGFHHGSFRALTPRAIGAEYVPGPRVVRVEGPPWRSVGAPLGQVELPIFALNLSSAPPGGLASLCLSERIPMRSIGAVYNPSIRYMRATILSEDFDILLFVQETTASRPVE